MKTIKNDFKFMNMLLLSHDFHIFEDNALSN